MALFEVTANDRRIYEEELKDFLPDKIFDSKPPCLRLSLEKVKTKFDDSRSDVDES